MRRQFVIFLLLIWACTVESVLAQSSYNVPESGSQTVTTCDAWIYDNGGENGDYSNYNEGYLVIYPMSGGGLVSVTSGTYSVESNYDYVEIYSGVGTNGLLLETLTGQNGTLSHAVTSRDASGALTIRFHSDVSIVKSGFALHVQCINPVVMSSETLSGCSFYWTDPGGTGNYANNENVIQTICSDNGEFLTVDFTQFSLSNGDYLYVYDGNSISATLIGTYTGTTLPGLIVSSGSCLTFRFTSNNTGVSSGWTAIVLCSSCSSGGNPASTNPGSPCAFDNIHPFCTDQGQYVYNSGSTGSASDFFGTGSVGCLSSTPAPAWYYMRIEQPGDITIHITQQSTYGGGLDVDFACWGPFSATSTNNFVDNLCCGLYQLNIEYHGSNTYVSGYPFGNLVDCSFDAASTEDCHIHNAQTGQFYLLLITNYSQSPGVIYFNSTAGSTATTDCSIMAEVSNDGPYCVGDTIHLYCNNPQSGATYQWTGPNGWTSTQADPVIYPATAAMNGYTYSLVKTMNGTSSSPASTTIEVIEVNTSVTVNPSNATICRGSSATLTASNVNGYQNTYSWSPGGQSNRTITVAPNTTTTYTVTQTVNGCEGTASVTVTVHQPQHQSYTVNQCASSYRWSVNNQTYTHSGTFTYAHTDAYGCTQVDTLHLTLGNTQERHIYASVCLGTPYNQNGFNITSAETGVAGAVERTNYGTGDNGCDSTTVLHLTVKDTVVRHIYASVCLGTPYNQNGFNITSAETGVAGAVERTNYGTGANGCDSTTVLHLTVKDTVVHHIYASVCPGTPYNQNGFNITSVETGVAGVIERTRPGTGANGCDSTTVLHLTVNDTVMRHIYASVCLGTPYNQNGFNITSVETGVAGVIERTRPGTGANGCDSTTVLHLTVKDTVVHHIYASVCLGTPYNQDGFNITSVETGVPGVIERTNSATGANGCDSTVVLHLTVYPSMHTDTTVVAYDQFVWNGSVYEEGGVYTYSHFDVNGCEQVDTLHLTLYYSSHTHLFDTACLSYFWYGRTYSASGEYDYLLQDIHGADSLLTLHLTILDNDTTEFDKQVCFFYSWEGSTYYEEGDYTKTLTNSRGCDSIVTLHLSIQDTIYTDFDMEACNFFMWNNVKLTTSGLYDHVYNVAEGCDSMVTLNLTIYYDTTVVVYQTACESYTWNDSVYTQSGSYERHFNTVHGCDSAVTLVLTINHQTSSNLDSTICDTDFPFEWNGALFAEPGMQHATLVNAAGCDSLITMKLSVNPTTFAVLSDTIIENDLPYDTLGMHFTDAGVLSDTIVNVKGCDSIVTMHLTVLPNVQMNVDSTVCENQLPVRWNEVVFTQAGVQSITMAASNRVDSVVIMHLYVNPNTYSEVYDTVIQNNLPHTFLGRTFSDSVSDARIVIPNAQGCDSVITYSLFVWRNVEATADTLVCEADLPLVWNGVVFVEEGDSSVTLTGAHGVDSLLMMRVRVSPSGYAELHEEVCMNDFPYRYVNGEIDTTIVSVSAPLSTFRFQLRTLAGCDSIVTLDLDVTDTVLNIVSTDDFCTNMHTTLTVVSDLTDYVWSTGETTASIEVYEPGYYWVTASQGDCEGRAFLRVDACKMEVRLPNAITPGIMDGLNDCFRLPEACLEHIETFEITVFNRWGEVVFHSKDKNFKWYGDYKGEVYREDVYSYTIKYIDTDGIMFRMKGAITVL